MRLAFLAVEEIGRGVKNFSCLKRWNCMALETGNLWLNTFKLERVKVVASVMEKLFLC